MSCFLVLFMSVEDWQTGSRLSRMQEEAREYLISVEKQMQALRENINRSQPEDATRLERARQ